MLRKMSYVKPIVLFNYKQVCIVEVNEFIY
jgi:hypothetical protein